MTGLVTKGGTINQHGAEKHRRFDLTIYTTSSDRCRVRLHLRCLLQSDANRRQIRKQAVPTRATVVYISPHKTRRRWEEGTGQEEEEEEKEKEEEEAGSEDKLTTLATWAVLGRFEWSRAKIVYSERKAGSAIIPASI